MIGVRCVGREGDIGMGQISEGHCRSHPHVSACWALRGYNGHC